MASSRWERLRVKCHVYVTVPGQSEGHLLETWINPNHVQFASKGHKTDHFFLSLVSGTMIECLSLDGSVEEIIEKFCGYWYMEFDDDDDDEGEDGDDEDDDPSGPMVPGQPRWEVAPFAPFIDVPHITGGGGGGPSNTFITK